MGCSGVSCDHADKFARRQGGYAGRRDGVFQVLGLVDGGIGGTDRKTLSFLHGLAEPFRHQPGGFTAGLTANDIPAGIENNIGKFLPIGKSDLAGILKAQGDGHQIRSTGCECFIDGVYCNGAAFLEYF